jgi:hypothetical protein
MTIDFFNYIRMQTPLLVYSEICRRMREEFPEFMDKLEAQGVRYIRVMPADDDPSSAIGRGWKSTFLTESRGNRYIVYSLYASLVVVVLYTEDAEEKLRALGSTWEWLENGDLKTITAVLPAIRVDEGINRSGERTFFNSMVAAYTGWTDSRNDGRRAVQLADGSFCDEDAMNAATRIMDEISARIAWQKNDFVLIDNRTVMHARKPFEGKRRVLASLVKDPSR